MPFTLAHPAAVLPLRGIAGLRTAPLIIGAMIPDLPYYVPSAADRALSQLPETHRFEGSFTTCLVLGYALLAAVFLLRRPLTALLSVRARRLCLGALAPFSRRPLEWLLAPLAILLGVWTHLFWDSFTHMDGWMVHRVAALSAPVVIGPYTGTVCHVLQYLSSVFGLAVMGVWYWRLPAAPAAPAEAGAIRSSVGPVLLLVGAAAILIGGVQATEYFERTSSVYRTANIFLTHSLAWFAALYLVAGIIVTLEEGHEGDPQPRA
jgi:Domain of unknown function (DUF4184)